MSVGNFPRGDTKKYLVKVLDNLNQPVDITTGYTVRMTLKINPASDADTDPLPNALSIVGVVTNGPAGEAEITLPSDSTKLLTGNQTYSYDVQVTQDLATPVVTTIDSGSLKVTLDTTETDTPGP